MANLFIQILRDHVKKGTFNVHDFVIMPNHVHLLLTVPGDLSVEKAVQLIKGGFSYRARTEIGFQGEVWQKGFSEVGVRTRESFLEHRRYIEQNPVKSGLTADAERYSFGSLFFKCMKHQEKCSPREAENE